MTDNLSPLDGLSDLTGLSKQEVLSIFEQVKRNQQRLSLCGWHEFEPAPGQDERTLLTMRSYICTRCGGSVDHHGYHWHQQGRRPKPEQEQHNDPNA